MTAATIATCARCGGIYQRLADNITLCPDCKLDELTPEFCQDCGAPLPEREPGMKGAYRKLCDPCLSAHRANHYTPIKRTAVRREKSFRAIGYLNPGGAKPDIEDLGDWLSMTWDFDDLAADVKRGYLPPGIVITTPQGKTVVVAKGQRGLLLRNIWEVIA